MFRAMLIKEFLLVSRDKHALAALFVMPAVFILIMSLALKDVFNEEKALIEYAVVDRDNSLESLSVVSKLRANRVLNEHNVTTDFKTPKEEGVQFIVVIPKGFKSQFSGDADTNVSLQIEVASDIAQTHLMLFKTQIITAFMQVQLDALNLAREMRGQGAETKKIAFDEGKMMKDVIKKRVLVTGGAGFLGINLARHLLESGHAVASLDLVVFDYPESDRIEVFTGDIRNPEAVRKAMAGRDAVVHAAAALPLYTREEIRSTDITGTRIVMEEAVRAGVARVVHISSTAVYEYNGHEPRKESDPLGDNHRAMFPTYSISKIAAETVCRFVAHQHFGVIS